MSVFEKKLDEVIEVLINGKLKKNLDDTLFEKLLGVLADKFAINANQQEQSYAVKLFKESKFQVLFDTIFRSLEENEGEPESHIVSFTINSLGLFAEEEDIFCCVKDNHVFSQFARICIKNSISPFEPSIHAAILTSMTRFAKHVLGLKWLISYRVFDAVFVSFNGSSYYVRKDAAAFFSTAFIRWSQLSQDHALCNFSSTFHAYIEKVIKLLLSCLPSEERAFIQDTSTIILHSCMQNCEVLLKLFCEKFELGKKLCEFWKNVATSVIPSESLLDVIADSCLYSQKNICTENIFEEIMQAFLKHKLLSSIITLSGKILKKQCDCEAKVSLNQISIIIWPLTVVTKSPASCEISSDYSEIMNAEMTDKMSCLLLVRRSLNTLTQFLHMMDEESLSHVIKVCCSIFVSSGMESSEFYFLAENRKIRLSALQLFSELLNAKSYPKLSVEMQTLMTGCLMKLIEGSSADFNFTSQAILLIGRCVSYNISDVWEQEVCQNFGQILQKKLLDNKWPVVDSAVLLSIEIVQHVDTCSKWYDFICLNDIIGIIWNLTFASEAEGYVRASAVRFITSVYFTSLQKKLLDSQDANEISLIAKVCELSDSPDLFIERECLLCLHRWIQKGNNEDNELIHVTMCNFIKFSLDMEAHLIALRIWQSIAEKFSTKPEKLHINTYIEKLCSMGYGFSVLTSLHSHDNSVKMEAIKLLINLRQILCNLGFNESSLDEELSADDSQVSETDVSDETQLDNMMMKLYTKEEKDAAINDVLEMGTAGQIYRVLRPIDLTIQAEVISGDSSEILKMKKDRKKFVTPPLCSKSEFWKTLWSQRICDILDNCNKSSDIYANNPCALLDDIVAAKLVPDDFSVHYQQPDCY